MIQRGRRGLESRTTHLWWESVQYTDRNVHTNSVLIESSIVPFRLNFTYDYAENVIAYSWRIFLLKILTKLYVVPSCIQRAYKQRFNRIIDFCISFEFHVRLCWKCYCKFLKNVLVEKSNEWKRPRNYTSFHRAYNVHTTCIQTAL